MTRLPCEQTTRRPKLKGVCFLKLKAFLAIYGGWPRLFSLRDAVQYDSCCQGGREAACGPAVLYSVLASREYGGSAALFERNCAAKNATIIPIYPW